MLKLVTGCNAGYLPRMMRYLETLAHHADFPVYLVGVGFNPPEVDGIEVLSLGSEHNPGSPPQTESMQHGSFIQVVPARYDTVLLFTDGDFIMQRPLDDGERAFLDLPDDAVAVGYNGGPSETLMHEAGRLGLQYPGEALVRLWGDEVYTWPIYNVGAIAMNKRTWRRVYDYYLSRWDEVSAAFSHQARQQWLISYALNRLGLDVRIMPWSLHAHGHFGLKPGMSWGGDGIYHDGKLALFRHYL